MSFTANQKNLKYIYIYNLGEEGYNNVFFIGYLKEITMSGLITAHYGFAVRKHIADDAIFDRLARITSKFVHTGRIADEDLYFAKQNHVIRFEGWKLHKATGTKIYSSYEL